MLIQLEWMYPQWGRLLSISFTILENNLFYFLDWYFSSLRIVLSFIVYKQKVLKYKQLVCSHNKVLVLDSELTVWPVNLWIVIISGFKEVRVWTVSCLRVTVTSCLMSCRMIWSEAALSLQLLLSHSSPSPSSPSWSSCSSSPSPSPGTIRNEKHSSLGCKEPSGYRFFLNWLVLDANFILKGSPILAYNWYKSEITWLSSQGRVIAYNLCRNIPGWDHLIGNGTSWCSDKIFNYHFQLSLHCPCFSLLHNSSSTASLPPFKV